MEKFLTVLGAILLVAVLALIFAFPTMWLWNWLMPAIFGLCKITFWQALGINLFTSILFKNSSSKN